jgi:hypothetical protein
VDEGDLMVRNVTYSLFVDRGGLPRASRSRRPSASTGMSFERRTLVCTTSMPSCLTRRRAGCAWPTRSRLSRPLFEYGRCSMVVRQLRVGCVRHLCCPRRGGGGAGLGTMWDEQLANQMLAGFTRIDTKKVPKDVFNATTSPARSSGFGSVNAARCRPAGNWRHPAARHLTTRRRRTSASARGRP